MKTTYLDFITTQDVKSFTESGVYSRGFSYYKGGRVHNVTYKNGELSAEVAGSEPVPYSVLMYSTAKDICDMSCECLYVPDGHICKHIVATLLQWIEKRDKRRMPLPELSVKKGFNPLPFYIPKLKNSVPKISNKYQKPAFFDVDDEDDRPTNVFYDLFSALGNVDLKVDLLNGGPQLEIRLVSDQGDETVLHISPEKSPVIFEKLTDEQYPNIEFSERIQQTKLHKTPLVPHLHAHMNDQGHIELSPVLKTKNFQKKEQAFPWEELKKHRIGKQWIWHNNTYRPIEPVPFTIQPYFNNEKPLVYKENDAVEFLRRDFGALLTEPLFMPSEQLRHAEVHDNPNVAHVQVEVFDNDWLWLDPTYKVGKHTISLSEIMSCLDNNGCIRKEADYIKIPKDILDLWERGRGVVENGRIKIPKLGYLRTRAECGKQVKVTACTESQKFLMNFDRITPPQPAPPVVTYKGDLRNYQKTGYDWLWFLHTNSFHGILADEMGLGKTHQAMVLVLSALHMEPQLPSLIICPTSVLDHWEAKFQSFAPEVKVARFYGKERNSIITENLSSVVLTTYSILSRDVEGLSKIQWNYVVLDEAQKIKNHNAQMSKATRSLNAKHRLALTGTPIENRLSELWSIFDFLMPGYLGSLQDFKARYENPITKYQDDEKREMLKKIIHPFKLRRLKKDVLTELPPKTEEKRYCTLTPAQIVMYKDLVNQEGSKLIMKLQDESRPVEYIHIFALLTKLKRLCNHPKLILNGKTPKGIASGKFELFKEIMEETLESGEKVVVFSQYLEMLDMMGYWLNTLDVKYETLRGSTRDRGKVVERFQTDPNCNVFLGSLMAGGLGIDLTSASVVIHYDRWWNAAREDQATDRVHRIGQTRGVQVFKLITKGTLEEKIDSMITKKAALMNSIVESDDVVFKAFSRRELIELLTF